MADSRRHLTGAESAAVLLMSLGEEHAARVLKHMGPREVQKLGAAMSAISNVSRSQVGEVLQDFVQAVQAQTAVGLGSDEYVSNVLQRALGPEKAEGVINHVLRGRKVKGLEALTWMDPQSVAEVIRTEHPQIIALVISQLDPDQAASVLAELPEESRVNVLMRVARMDDVHPSALKELDEVLSTQFSAAGSLRTPVTGGSKSVADILNYMDPGVEKDITRRIADLDANLGQEIQDLMFVFDNLKEVNDRGIQALLREVSSESLVLALKGADESVKEKIFKNMSKRAAEILRDDLETKGPVKLSEVQGAQKEILAVAQRMAESGELALGSKGGDQYV
jgi:flagellar motor switch protein FliG